MEGKKIDVPNVKRCSRSRWHLPFAANAMRTIAGSKALKGRYGCQVLIDNALKIKHKHVVTFKASPRILGISVRKRRLNLDFISAHAPINADDVEAKDQFWVDKAENEEKYSNITNNQDGAQLIYFIIF